MLIKRIAAGIIATLCATLIALLIAEFVVRVTHGDKITLFPRYHTDAHYGEFTLRRIRPNTIFWHTSIDGSWKFIIDNHGLRNSKNLSYDKPLNTVRVLSLGDSHTQGYEVRQDYTFSAVAEKYLLRRGRKAEVINAGISGFGTEEALLFLENEGVKYQPDVVVLAFYANDLEDNLKSGFFKLDQNNTLNLLKHEHIPGVAIQNIIYELPLVDFLSQHSYFYSLLFNTVWDYSKNLSKAKVTEKVTEYAIPMQETVSDYQVRLAAALIKRMHQFCKAHNIKLVIADIPVLTAQNGIRSSFPVSMINSVRAHSDAFIFSESLLAEHNGAVELHVPHGHRHISELTHAILGVSIGREVDALTAGSKHR